MNTMNGMIYMLDTIQNSRKTILETIEPLSLAQLNHIPKGFNNNIIWNVAHLIAAQQGLCYIRGNHPIQVSQHLFDSYKPNTKPQADVSEAEVLDIKQQLISTIEQTKSDLAANRLVNYTPFVNRAGDAINHISEAIFFASKHDFLHMGTILALKRLVNFKN